MREIKFRAWDKILNKMIFTNEGNDYNFWDIVAFSSVQMSNEIFKDKRYIFMQYTVLKDKNGVEIYEGDILSSQRYSNVTGTVVYRNGKFMCIDENSLYEDLYYYEMEVISNIYENKELLEGK